MNVHDERDHLALMERCAFEAVQVAFPHLSVAHIRKPPRPWFDAKLARQIAIHILNTEFDVPRHRITTMQARQRTSISFAMQAVQRRMVCPTFRAAYEGMAARAQATYARSAELG